MDKIENEISLNQTEIVVQLSTNIFSTPLFIFFDRENNFCTDCDFGLVIGGISVSEIGDNVDILVTVDNDMLIPLFDTFLFTIIGCPIGQGVDENNQTCITCGNGYYNIKANTVQKCATCTSKFNKNAICADGLILIPADHWMTMNNHTGAIITSACPPGYCCNTDFCDYLNDKDTLCAEGKNYESKLCGRCKVGYSEAINGSFALIMALLLIVINLEKISKTYKKPKEMSNKCWSIFTSDYYRMMMKIMVFKCLMYYEQAIAQLYLSNPTRISVMAFASMFDLSIVSNTGNPNNLWCLYDGMNAKQLILLDLFVPIMIVVFIVSFYIIPKSWQKKQ